MNYCTQDGTVYDVSVLDTEGRRLFGWLIREYNIIPTWQEFTIRTATSIIEYAKRSHGASWQTAPLYQIQLDLMTNIGIERRQFRGRQSRIPITSNDLDSRVKKQSRTIVMTPDIINNK